MKAVLEAIRVKYPTAIIAGGAPRDFYYGKEVKDIDVWIAKDMNSLEFETIGTTEFKSVSSGYPDSTMNVLKGTMFGVDVDIIFVACHDNEVDIVNDFADDLSKVWFDGTIHVCHESREAYDRKFNLFSYEDKAIDRNSRALRRERMMRIKDKYPEIAHVRKVGEKFFGD
jgi:hypothetical protein